MKRVRVNQSDAKVVIRAKAKHDLIELADYIAMDNINAAERFIEATESSFRSFDPPNLIYRIKILLSVTSTDQQKHTSYEYIQRRQRIVSLPRKMRLLNELQSIVGQRKASGKQIVWTNGCFDLLHAGHVTYLLAARAQGDVLVIGLNSDASVRENKGPGRPITNEQDRALVLSALACVDYVVIFSDKTPLPLLEMLKPDVYAKGGDYTIDTIDQEERRLVEGYGGSIVLLPGVVGASTTSIIEKLQDSS